MNNSRGGIATGIEFLHEIGITDHVVTAGTEGVDEGFCGLDEAGDFTEEDNTAEEGAVGDCADADHTVRIGLMNKPKNVKIEERG